MAWFAAIIPALGSMGSMFSMISTGVSIFGMLQGSSSKSGEQEYNAALMQRNSTIALQNARLATEQAAVDEDRHRRAVSKIIGQQIVGYGKAGVQATGTPLIVEEETMIEGELDALLIRHQGTLRANAYRAQAADFTAQGLMAEQRAESTRTSGFLSAAGTLIGGVGKAANITDLSTSRIPTYATSGLSVPRGISGGYATDEVY